MFDRLSLIGKMQRWELFLANAALPALLPMPPTTKMLLSSCIVVPPAAASASASPCSKRKPCRADTVERWDAHKTSAGVGSPPSTPPAKRPASDRSRSLCRADACERWDSSKMSPSKSSTSSSSSPSSSRGSSAERWDIHKKPRAQVGALDSDKDVNAMAISPTDKETSMPQNDETIKFGTAQRMLFAGPATFASPEPSMLPFPMYLVAH